MHQHPSMLPPLHYCINLIYANTILYNSRTSNASHLQIMTIIYYFSLFYKKMVLAVLFYGFSETPIVEMSALSFYLFLMKF
jgi:hypothetical protein